jgi:DTW domain-containing protein YfiP
MSRRDNALHRCLRCRMLGNLCVCALIPSPRLVTRTRLVLLIHRYEERKPTNTGRLAAECLENSEVVVRGHASQPTPAFVSAPERQTLLLFPHEGATPLADFPIAPERPVTLLVPDGNWRQASKVRQRVPGLRDVPCVTLPAGEPSSYRLRAEAHEGGLSTLEAIARAMGVLEGDPVRRALEAVFRAMVERTLWSRGTMTTGEVGAGIPEGTLLHDLRRAPPGTTGVTTSRPDPR